MLNTILAMPGHMQKGKIQNLLHSFQFKLNLYSFLLQSAAMHFEQLIGETGHPKKKHNIKVFHDDKEFLCSLDARNLSRPDAKANRNFSSKHCRFHHSQARPQIIIPTSQVPMCSSLFFLEHEK